MVMPLGEDGEQWLVLDADSPEHAIAAAREFESVESGYLCPGEELYARHRTDLVWRHGGLRPNRFEDDELLTRDKHFAKYALEAKRVHPFAGHLVSTNPFKQEDD